MASEEQQETLTLGVLGSVEPEDDEVEEREIRELEREVSEMGRRILDYRKSIPNRLIEALSSRLVAQRPLLSPPIGDSVALPSFHIAQTGASRDLEPGAEVASLADADQEMLEKLRTFRSQTATNIAAMPAILKRMKESIARIDKVEDYNVNIHPVFKRKRKH